MSIFELRSNRRSESHAFLKGVKYFCHFSTFLGVKIHVKDLHNMLVSITEFREN